MPNGPTEVGLSIWEDEGNGGGREREECERGGRNVRGMGGGLGGGRRVRGGRNVRGMGGG